MLDYTRVSDDALILCRRKDFPRAVNVLQRRKPDRRRWRVAFRQVAYAGTQSLDGPRHHWLEGALREVVGGLNDRRLRGELAVDAAELGARFNLGTVLPEWTARDLWRHAEAVDLPMEYIAMVTELPRVISATIDTPRVIAACRRTADAHRALALEHGAGLSPSVIVEEARGALGLVEAKKLAEMRAQQEAARRWRELGHRLFGSSGES